MTKQEMTQKAKEILPIIQALAEGKEVTCGTRYPVPGSNCMIEDFLKAVDPKVYKVKPSEYYLVKRPDGGKKFFISLAEAEFCMKSLSCCELITLIEKP
jgi:hypothetical protein